MTVNSTSGIATLSTNTKQGKVKNVFSLVKSFWKAATIHTSRLPEIK
jgi:hypothetical protein